MPQRQQRQKRNSRKGRSTGPDCTPEKSELAGEWYYDNIAEENRHPSPNLPDPPLIWTAVFPSFKRALDSTIKAWYRLTGSLPIARRCYKVWEETQDMIAVYREAITAAAGTGYHSTEEVAVAIASLPDSPVERKKFYQRMAAESHNADRAQRGQTTVWDQIASTGFENPLVREMNPTAAFLTLLWVSDGLWLCDTSTIEGYLTAVFRRFDVQVRITERQITDEIRRLGLYRYEGDGRLILAKRGPEPDARLREEMRALAAGRKAGVETGVSLKNGNQAERIQSES